MSDETDPAAILSNVEDGPFGPVSYNLGNGLAGAYSYDALGRLSGGTLSSGGTQVYGFADGWKGKLLTGSSDSVLNQGSTYGYDEFNRLASLTVNAGTGPNYGWVYDRYGNRLQQNITGGTGSGSTFSASVNPANNQLTGYTYDAAGNMTNDNFHSYTYDAEGHITAVDGGQTATYVYNALGQRVRSVVGSTITEYVFNAAGQRVSEWNGTTHLQLKGKYYWGSKPVAYYANGATHFEHQDWMGTERLRTTYNGAVEGVYGSLPFGDGQAATGADTDANHYAQLDHDVETDTDYAEFRQYSNAQGRWLSPDPYHGSYKMRNPQSFNRYVYAGNNPLTGVDPSGLQVCSITSCGWNKAGGGGGGNPLTPGWGETGSTSSGSDADAGTDGFGDDGNVFSDQTGGSNSNDGTSSDGTGNGGNGNSDAPAPTATPIDPGTIPTVPMETLEATFNSDGTINSIAIDPQCQVGNCSYTIYYQSFSIFGNICASGAKTDRSPATTYSVWDCAGDKTACADPANYAPFQKACTAQGQTSMEYQDQLLMGPEGAGPYEVQYCACCDYNP